MDSDAAVGHRTKNPFNFKARNLTQIYFTVDGERYPSEPLTMDFPNDLTARAYGQTLEVLGYANEDCTDVLTKQNFEEGATIIAFDLTTDGLDCEDTGFRPSRTGLLTLDMQFGTALAEAVNVYVLGFFSARLEIDRLRGVTCDY